jgi:cell division ATPase MinD
MLMSKIIGILSGKGGVGKTTLAANLSTLLQLEFGRNVAVVDGNITSPSLGLHFGFHEKFPVSLNDVLEGHLKIQKCIYVHPTIGVSIIPCNFAFYSDKHVEKMRKAVRDLRYDYIIIDSAPGLGKEAITTLETSDEIIIITVPQFVDVSNALKTLQLARKMKKRVVGVVLNRVQHADHEISIDEIEKLCGCRILAEIPEDREVQKATYRGSPIVVDHPNSSTAQKFREIALAVAGKLPRAAKEGSLTQELKEITREEAKKEKEARHKKEKEKPTLGDISFLDRLTRKKAPKPHRHAKKKKR